MTISSNNFEKINLKEIDSKMSKIELLLINLKKEFNEEKFQQIKKEFKLIEHKLIFLQENNIEKDLINELLNQLKIMRTVINNR
ncbi:hypothetical protein JDS99_30060 [Bacillus cereus group sp. N6]|uniref:hypothetical protein n=1 Tax=Bacillus cereus group sp. N6 TaxID=2794583 RepID=UPI0018F7A5A2|nr:hypothetical protein [Bacillus cereus group sp. N6]MBJ8113762.1 hypothetical protein [Bacillus cereus group sp. N6]